MDLEAENFLQEIVCSLIFFFSISTSFQGSRSVYGVVHSNERFLESSERFQRFQELEEPWHAILCVDSQIHRRDDLECPSERQKSTKWRDKSQPRRRTPLRRYYPCRTLNGVPCVTFLFSFTSFLSRLLAFCSNPWSSVSFFFI